MPLKQQGQVEAAAKVLTYYYLTSKTGSTSCPSLPSAPSEIFIYSLANSFYQRETYQQLYFWYKDTYDTQLFTANNIISLQRDNSKISTPEGIAFSGILYSNTTNSKPPDHTITPYIISQYIPVRSLNMHCFLAQRQTFSAVQMKKI